MTLQHRAPLQGQALLPLLLLSLYPLQFSENLAPKRNKNKKGIKSSLIKWLDNNILNDITKLVHRASLIFSRHWISHSPE